VIALRLRLAIAVCAFVLTLALAVGAFVVLPVSHLVDEGNPAASAFVGALASSYRYDSAGTAAGTAVFLSRHLWLVTRLRDSLARSGTAAQRNSLTKSAAARAATAIKR